MAVEYLLREGKGEVGCASQLVQSLELGVIVKTVVLQRINDSPFVIESKYSLAPRDSWKYSMFPEWTANANTWYRNAALLQAPSAAEVVAWCW